MTKTLIDALPTPQSDIVYWDAALPGFGVKVTPKGRKVFIVLYRTGGAGSKAVQVYHRLMRSATLHHARVAAQKVFAARLDRRDPAAEKREKKRRVVADRVDDLLEAFIDQRLSHDTDTWPQSTAERCTVIAHGAPRAREGDREAITECLNFMSPMGRDLLSRFRCGRERLHGRASHPTLRNATTNLQNRRQVWLLGVGTNAASYLQWLLSSPAAVGFYGQLLV